MTNSAPLLSPTQGAVQDRVATPSPDGANSAVAGHVHVRVRQSTHNRLVRLGGLLGTKSNDETVALLLDLYEVNSGTFAPTDIKDMSILLQQLLVMLAAVNATHMEILEVVRAEHIGVYAKVRALSDDLQRELARVRAIKFPAA